MRNFHVVGVMDNPWIEAKDRMVELRKLVEEWLPLDSMMIWETVYAWLLTCSDLNSSLREANKRDKFEYWINPFYNTLFALEEALGWEFIGKCLTEFINVKKKV